MQVGGTQADSGGARSILHWPCDLGLPLWASVSSSKMGTTLSPSQRGCSDSIRGWMQNVSMRWAPAPPLCLSCPGQVRLANRSRRKVEQPADQVQEQLQQGTEQAGRQPRWAWASLSPELLILPECGRPGAQARRAAPCAPFSLGPQQINRVSCTKCPQQGQSPRGPSGEPVLFS